MVSTGVMESDSDPAPTSTTGGGAVIAMVARSERASHMGRAAARQTGATPAHRLRVVFVDHCAQPSGAELALARLIAHFEGIDAHVILGEHGPMEQRFADAGACVEVLPLGAELSELPRQGVRMGAAAARRGGALPGAVWNLRRRLQELQPDLVHTNSLKAHLYGGMAARLAGCPVVWHLRDRVACDYLPREAVSLLRSSSRVLPHAVIANSGATLDTVPGGRIRVVVPSPVDLEVPTHRSDPTRPFTAIMVGRLAPWKGQHVFIDAFADAFPEGCERALIVGSALFGEHDHEAALRQQIADRGLDDRVVLLGFRDDVPELLADSDVLVHASVVPEPFGQVVVQGMAAGLPVVATDAGGPAETVADGVDGVLVPMGDRRHLTQVLRELAGDPERREALGAAARQRAQSFGHGPAVAGVSAAYRRLASVSRMLEVAA